MVKRTAADVLVIGGEDILPGERRNIDIPVAPTYTHDTLSISVQVIRGKLPGPTLFVCAAIHGDEINGVEIIRRVTRGLDARTIAGTVIAVPIVNVHGFLNGDRYLPDRRDLNRSFPGSPSGSLAAAARNELTSVLGRRPVGDVRLLTQVGMRGWGAYLAIQSELTGGMVIAASIIAPTVRHMS